MSGSATRIGVLPALLTALALALASGGVVFAQFPDSPFSTFGQPSQDDIPAVSLSLSASKTVAVPGDQIALAIVLDHAPRFHTWPNEPVIPEALGDFPAIATKARLTGRPEGVSHVGPIQWPEPHAVPVNYGSGPLEILSYEGRAVAYLPLVIAQDAAPGERTFEVTVDYQACNDTICLPPDTLKATVSIEIVPTGSSGAPPENPELFSEFDQSVFGLMLAGDLSADDDDDALIRFDAFGAGFSLDPRGGGGFVLLLLTAALGGFLLNLTPCVLPVIPIKILGLSQSAGDRKRAAALGLVMCAGVVGFWMAIGLAIAFISGFDAISSLFQTPYFATVVGAFIAFMGVGMLGLFTFKLPRAVYMVNPTHETAYGSFLFGVMTAILSTPCTAPFMGAAAAWAATQNSSVVLSTFAAIGAGMALPYLILSANPKWVERVPRTGPGSELVKQVLGLLLLAVAAFFLGTGLSSLLKGAGEGASQMYWWAVAAFIVAAMVWLVVRTFRITGKAAPRVVFAGLGVVLSAASVAGAMRLTAKPPIEWVTYSEAAFADAIDRGDVVVLDFTADWCLNCKTLEQTVLYTDRVVERVSAEGVVPMKIDLTGDNPEGKAKLREVGRVAIPLLAIYGPATPGPWLSDSYTPEQVVGAIAAARGGEPVGPGPRD